MTRLEASLSSSGLAVDAGGRRSSRQPVSGRIDTPRRLDVDRLIGNSASDKGDEIYMDGEPRPNPDTSIPDLGTDEGSGRFDRKITPQ